MHLVCDQIYSSFFTIKHSTAILSGGSQRFAGRVQLVAIVPNAELKLDWFSGFLNHGCAVEDCTKTVLPPPLVLLRDGQRHGKEKEKDVTSGE